jgi:hypothetical protein
LSSYEVILQEQSGVTVVKAKGYFSVEAGKTALAGVEGLLEMGKLLFVLDFSECAIINSPGIVAIMDLTYRIVEDFQGKLVLSGLDQLKKNVLKMAGVLAKAQVAESISEGLNVLMGKTQKQ